MLLCSGATEENTEKKRPKGRGPMPPLNTPLHTDLDPQDVGVGAPVNTMKPNVTSSAINVFLSHLDKHLKIKINIMPLAQ